MERKAVIEHKGIVTETSQNSVLVELTVMSACAACHAKSLCSMDSTQKTIQIFDPKESYNIGEMVNVVMQESLGRKAMVLGYIIPFFVLLFSLIIFTFAGIKEGLSGLLSIAMLVPYFTMLYVLKDKIKKEFKFNIEKI